MEKEISDKILITTKKQQTMNLKQISKDNKLTKILDFGKCKKLVSQAKKNNENYVILCGHYSINIATNSKYDNTDPEQLQWDLDELSDYIGNYVSVSDYDDLVVDMTNYNED